LGIGSYPNLLLYLLFFCSGLSGLIYQVVWVRVFGNVFGNTVYSASVVVAVFMLGLGAGSYLAGAWSDRQYAVRPDRPLRAYGYFEIAIAAMGFVIALVLPHLDRLSVLVTSYEQDVNGWYVITPASYVARAAIALALLMPITLLMGGTLTLLIRHLVRSDVKAQGRRIALLYAVNTAGAAVGCFLTDFTLVPAWGLRNTQFIAVALNIVAGVGVMLLVRLKADATGTLVGRALSGPPPSRPKKGRLKAAPTYGAPTSATSTPHLPTSKAIVFTSIALALSGFAALGMEILWFRHFSIMLGAFRAVFSLLLTVILVGIGAGALVAGVLQRHTRRPAEWLMAIQALFIAFTLIGMATADSSVIDRTVSNAMAGLGDRTSVGRDRIAWTLEELWFNLRPILLEVALPALLMGFAFPLANAVIQRAERSVGRHAGVLYLANTAGAVAGSLVAGFLLLPTLGLQGSATVLMIAATLGILPLYLAVRLKADTTDGLPVASGFSRTVVTGSFLIAIGSLAVWFLLPGDYVRTRALPQPDPNERVLNQSEGVNEIITVTETRGKGRRLMTNGHAMSATWPLSQRYMRALAHVPLLMSDNPERVLVIGFGVGNTTAAATLHPTVKRVEVADLSRNVLNHATYFSGVSGNVLKDARVAVYVNDGRHHLQMQPPESYDLIALEPPPIAYAGVAALYSEEFYALARTRLKPNGFISQWLPSYQVPTATTLSMIRAFIDVFPRSVLLSGAQADLILIGARDRIEIDANRLLAALSRRPAARADLARLDLGTPREIVGMFLGSAEKLAQATRDAVPVTDDRPVQEYGVRSLLNLGESVPAAIVDLTRVAAWCPSCFDNGVPVRSVEGLDLYLALLDRAYSETPQEGARIRRAADEGRIFAGSAYLGAVVPEVADVHNELGIALASKGQLDQAIVEFREALRLEPDSAQTHWHLGAALADRGALDEAAVHLRRSVELDPANEDARHDLAALLAIPRN
jgi:predicted membrane-bound spermidine synthase